MGIKIRKVYGGSALDRDNIPISREALEALANCVIATIIKEGKKDFAKRGWKLGDPNDKGPDFHKSWSFEIEGLRTIVIKSTYYGMKELTDGGIPERKMTWMTQEHKEKHPENFQLTPTEKKRGMKQTGKMSQGDRLPLIVPLKQKDGSVVLRFAPLTMQDAWVHPGIARFTFMQRAIRKARKECTGILKEEIRKYLAGENRK